MRANQVTKVRRNRIQLLVQQMHKQSNRETAWMQFIRRYSIGNHIHGFYQLFWPTMRQHMRFLWALALLFAFLMLLYMSFLLGHRYEKKPLQTVVATADYPIRKIAFPVVVVCNKNRLNWSRLSEIIQRYNISNDQQPLLAKVLTAYDALSFGHFDVFTPLKDQPLQVLNHLNFTKIVTEMAWRCDELLTDCTWHAATRDCCELFRPRRLPFGACLAFNEVEKRANAEFGRDTGLTLRLLLNEAHHAPENMRTKGFVLSLLKPNSWLGPPIEFFPGLDASIGIKAIYRYYNKNTYSVPRHCMRDYEHFKLKVRTLRGFKYKKENCIAECQQVYLLRYCNCTLDLFYPPSNYTACQLKDLPCLGAHNHLMLNYVQPGERPYVAQNHSGLDCHCLHNCNSLTLVSDVRTVLKKVKPTDNRTTIVNIFYNTNRVVVYKTSLIYNWVDLVVSFGAVFQLCLGCSLLGIVELLYFSLIDVPQFYWTHYVPKRIDGTIQ